MDKSYSNEVAKQLDLPPLLEKNGYAYMSLLIGKFKIK